MAMGLLFLFSQFVSAADLRVAIFNSFEFQLGSSVLFLPYLAIILLIYISDGTLATQQMIMGSLVLFGIFFYLAEITRLQCNWQGYAIAQGQSATMLDFLLQHSIYSMGSFSIAHLVDLIIIPISYNGLKNLKCRRLIAICGALLFTQIIDISIYSIIYYYKNNELWNFLGGAFFARTFFSIWLGVIINVYLGKVNNQNKGTFDIFFAFLGGYGKSKELQNYLNQSEDRYKTILENAKELIFLLGTKGNIIDCNLAAKTMLEKILPNYEHSSDLFHFMLPIDESVDKIDENDLVSNSQVSSFKAKIQNHNASDFVDLSCTLSHVVLQNEQILLLIGRDITNELQLQKEKQTLSDELAHSQRLEALGKLAGGIAHDFNNHIHAMLGHVDLLLMQKEIANNSKIISHLEKIGNIAEQSGKLTSQLLGFARKGKFYETTLDLNEVVKRAVEMVKFPSSKKINLHADFNDKEYLVKGDMVQLTQVIINLILNASDAMENSLVKDISLFVKEGICFESELESFNRLKKINLLDYYCIKICDTGSGITPENKQKIFEPFFTTKAIGEGTGMGLSMVYGTITNHHGFIHVESELGVGTTFYILLRSVAE